MRGWIWFVRRFGLVTAWRYWRAGQRRGWMTSEQTHAYMRSLQTRDKHGADSP